MSPVSFLTMLKQPLTYDKTVVKLIIRIDMVFFSNYHYIFDRNVRDIVMRCGMLNDEGVKVDPAEELRTLAVCRLDLYCSLDEP